jgi:acyl carrier protein
MQRHFLAVTKPQPGILPAENSGMSVRAEILDQFKQVAEEQSQRLGPLSDEAPLLDLGLDSLSFAILVSRLENVLGVDPFSETTDAPFPVNLGDFIRIYENAAR